MKKTFSSRKSAFSLIELSIVLIIIGLLIAGITGGASLIKSAELRNIVTEARAHSVSVGAFYSLYDSFPGDSAVTLASGNVGDNDGQMEFCRNGTPAAAGTCPDAAPFSGSEGGAGAWLHMRDAGVFTFNSGTAIFGNGGNATTRGNGVLGSAVAMSAGTSFPSSKTKQSGWVFDYDTVGLSNVAVLIGNIITAPIGGTAALSLATAPTTNVGRSITPADALSVDAKNDDGVANAGRIKGGGTTGIATAVDACFFTGSATYNVGNVTGKACSLVYTLDVPGQGS